MSTRSNVRVLCKDGLVRSIYVHFDGSQHLPTLKEHYNSQEKAEALVALGNLSVLDDSIECPDGHDFDHRVEGYCIAYGRDRGEEDQEAEVCKSFKEAWNSLNDTGIEYVYEWSGKKWKMYDLYRIRNRFEEEKVAV